MFLWIGPFQNSEIETVLLDNEKAATLAVDQFVESGYTDIAIVTTSIIRNISPRVERIAGYKKALERHQIQVNPNYIKMADEDNLSNALEELMTLENPPQAILAGNDLVLMEVLKYVKVNNLRIPEDLAVIGIDDVPFASFYTPSITTVSQPAVEMANQAVDLLIEQINGEHEKAEDCVYRLQPSLIKRDSC